MTASVQDLMFSSLAEVSPWTIAYVNSTGSGATAQIRPIC